MSRSVKSTVGVIAVSLAPNEMDGNRRRPMRVMVVRHHAQDSPGFIGAAFGARGAAITTHLFPAEGPLPAVGDADHLIVLGAVPSVYDDGPDRGWIAEELAWLRRGGEARVPRLGTLFGPQLPRGALRPRGAAAAVRADGAPS